MIEKIIGQKNTYGIKNAYIPPEAIKDGVIL
jgi:hypothetical protein